MRFLLGPLKCCTKEEGTLLQVATQEPQMRFFLFSCGVWRAKKPPFMNTFGLLADGHRGGKKEVEESPTLTGNLTYFSWWWPFPR